MYYIRKLNPIEVNLLENARFLPKKLQSAHRLFTSGSRKGKQK